MSGDIEHSKCDICGTVGSVSRKYYHYNIQCQCCNDQTDDHFEIVRHCNKCKPKPPAAIKAVVEPRETD